MKKYIAVILWCFSGLACTAQSKPGAKPIGPQSVTAPVVNSVDGIYYPVPSDVALKLLSLQHKDYALEVENQRMQVKIEQNHQLQQQVRYQEQGAAFEYATDKHIDLNLFQLDMQSDVVKFTPKKKEPKVQ
jgi:hypothetical protein